MDEKGTLLLIICYDLIDYLYCILEDKSLKTLRLETRGSRQLVSWAWLASFSILPHITWLMLEHRNLFSPIFSYFI